ncbi:MAG: hypothetical protein JXL97_07980 [Bacteroidales bacterium]|nr:hypothetical protein [Bacteroidales bacterium]
MKKTILLIITIIISNCAFAQKTVIDYYKILPDSLKHDYNLKFVENKWQTMSCVDYEIYPLVDISNGFIKITDEGTGGGTIVLTVVLYRQYDGSGLIGISFSNFDFMYYSCSTYFLDYKNNNWNIVNEKVLPDISHKNFMNKEYELADFDFNPYSIVFELPQHGTTIKLRFEYTYIKMLCAGAFENKSQIEKQAACLFQENVINDSIELFWDKKNTRFYLK